MAERRVCERDVYKRQLLDALKRCAAEKGLAFITLEVRASNAAAIALYKGAGFRPVGTRRNFYTAPQEDAVLMTWTAKE